MMLVVGLGNPGSKYHLTRHNIGFLAIDAILAECQKQNIDITPINKASFEGELYKTPLALFLKPHTFMNLSGNSVVKVAHFYKCDTIIVMHDDLDLPFAAIRFKLGGGDGGHKGLRSISACLNTQAYHRLRLGITRPKVPMEIAQYVLTPFTQEQLDGLYQETFPKIIQALFKIFQGESWEKVASLHSFKGIGQ